MKRESTTSRVPADAARMISILAPAAFFVTRLFAMRKITCAVPRFQLVLFCLIASVCSLAASADDQNRSASDSSLRDELQKIIEGNERSWAAYLKFVAGNTAELESAERENRASRAMAARIENPVALAWC